MNHLAQANQHIAELTVQIVRQRVIVKYALDTGQRSEMAESLLDALERSLRIFEKHRELVLDQLQRKPVPDCPAWPWRAVAFSPGGDGGRSPELPVAQSSYVAAASAGLSPYWLPT
jgi:hypothetical protein